MKTEDLHRHVCNATGRGMSEGWYIDGEYYSTQESADKKATQFVNDKGDHYKDFKELYEDCNDNEESVDDNTDFCYWTTWHHDNFDLEEEGIAYDDNGKCYIFNGSNWEEDLPF